MKRGGLQPDGSYILDDSEHYFTFDDEKSEKFYSEDQPRDDHGRWTDEGGGTETGVKEMVPVLAGEGPSPFASGGWEQPMATVKDLVSGSGVPAEHLDGIKDIHFGDFIENTPAFTTLGRYEPKDQTIKLNGELADTVAGDGTVLHEIGHHVYLGKLNDSAVNEWEQLHEQIGPARISARAQANAAEHFAEAYKAYYLGDRPLGRPYVSDVGTGVLEGLIREGWSQVGARAALKNMEPSAYRFMERLATGGFGMLPKGQNKPARIQYARYDPKLAQTLIREGKI